MNKEALLKRLSDIANELENPGADIKSLEEEYRQISADLNRLELRNNVLKDVENGSITVCKVDKIGIDKNDNSSEAEDPEKRAKAWLEERAVTVGASDIILPSHTSKTINPTFEEVGGIVDVVDTVSVIGGESYEQPYIKSYGTGNYTDEASDAADAEPEFGYAKITKTKITAYAEISKEMQKLTKSDYDSVVRDAMGKAIKKKIAREIFVGNGADGHFSGIFHNPSTNPIIDASTDIEIAAINNTTLDDIVFSFGGEEDTESIGSCVLFLNKKDLKAFASLRSTDGKKLHDIKINGNRGTIDTVPFIISSACKAMSDAKTNDGDYCMAYGYSKNYKNVIFSGVEVQQSKEFKFKQGMICYRGEVYIGGNVVSNNGFIRVKKKLSALSIFDITSTAGTTSGKTKITVDDVLGEKLKYKYKTAETVTVPEFDAVLTTGWTAWNGIDEITAAAGNEIIIAEVTINGSKCKGYGKTVVVSAQ